MFIFMCMVFVCFPLLLGTGISIFIDKKTSDKTVNLWEAYLCGFICCIGMFEIGHLTGVFAKQSVSDCGNIILGLSVAACFFSVLSLIVKRREVFPVRKELGSVYKPSIPLGVFGLLLAAQIYYIYATPMMQTPGDITLETINSFLATDEIYSVSPLTGKMFSGTPLRYEILCLPTVYTLLCKWFGVEPEMLVDNVIPAVTVCAAYMAYYLLGGTLFGKDKNHAEKRLWFMVIVAAIFFLCEGSVYMEGYGILHAGHLGMTIRNSVLVPLVIYAALEKKWIPALFCILAEACIVWTFWGFGVCVVIFAGVLVIDFIWNNKYVRKLLPELAGKGGGA